VRSFMLSVTELIMSVGEIILAISFPVYTDGLILLF